MIRTKNLSEHATCAYCRETGYVVNEGPDGKGYDCIVAPCPFCEAGAREEFPTVDANDRSKIRPPWDPIKGYWQGRSLAHLDPERKGAEITLSAEEQKQHLAAMGRTLGWLQRPDGLVKDL